MNEMLITLGRRYPTQQDLFLPLCVAGVFSGMQAARDAARARIERLCGLDALARQWAVMHMPIATSDGDGPLVLAQFPERQKPPVAALARRWGADVRSALLPVARRSPAAKLLRKGLPIPNSLRYLGLQFQRACATPSDAILVDVCRAYALGLCGDAGIEPAVLMQRWAASPSELYTALLSSMRSSELQGVLSMFLKMIVEQDVCSRRLFRAGLTHMESPGVIELLCRICRPAAACRPSAGFGICMERVEALEVRRALVASTGGVASAKRIRARLVVTPALKTALGRRIAALSVPGACPLPRQQADHQKRLPVARALLCERCGWLRSPVGKGGIEVDVETDQISCGKCAGPVCAVVVNGMQIWGPGSGVARMCDACGSVVTRFHPYGIGVHCDKCFSPNAPAVYRPVGARMPRAVARANRRQKRG